MYVCTSSKERAIEVVESESESGRLSRAKDQAPAYPTEQKHRPRFRKAAFPFRKARDAVYSLLAPDAVDVVILIGISQHLVRYFEPLIRLLARSFALHAFGYPHVRSPLPFFPPFRSGITLNKRYPPKYFR